VFYYVTEENRWNYANSIPGIPNQFVKYFLITPEKQGIHPLDSGLLSPELPLKNPPARYVYDPLDKRETVGPLDMLERDSKRFLVDKTLTADLKGRGLVYLTEPFANDTEITGKPKLVAAISLDVPDTDFVATLFEIKRDGSSIFLTEDRIRARYRESLSQEKLIQPGVLNRYEFNSFNFISRKLKEGSRIRLVLYSPHSIHWEKNYNSGGDISAETPKVARTAHITLQQDQQHQSYLVLPIVSFPSRPSILPHHSR
jgi:uncharacterized protein